MGGGSFLAPTLYNDLFPILPNAKGSLPARKMLILMKKNMLLESKLIFPQRGDDIQTTAAHFQQVFYHRY